jgi:hypothetical protein
MVVAGLDECGDVLADNLPDAMAASAAAARLMAPPTENDTQQYIANMEKALLVEIVGQGFHRA